MEDKVFEKLIPSGCKFTDNLTNVRVWSSVDISPECLSGLGRLTKLQVLVLIGNRIPGKSDPNTSCVMSISRILGSINSELELLILKFYQVDNAALDCISGMKQIYRLDLCFCDISSDIDLEEDLCRNNKQFNKTLVHLTIKYTGDNENNNIKKARDLWEKKLSKFWKLETFNIDYIPNIDTNFAS